MNTEKTIPSVLMIIVMLLFGIAPFVNAATISVSPSSQTVKEGDTFTVTIMLDTQNSSTDGVDINSLNYDPSILEIQDANPIEYGVQIQPGHLYPVTLSNSVDITSGKIDFSQVTTGGSNFTGQGTLATITFKAIASGKSFLNFDFIPNSTLDTNVASIGDDILSDVSGGEYVVGKTRYSTVAIVLLVIVLTIAVWKYKK